MLLIIKMFLCFQIVDPPDRWRSVNAAQYRETPCLVRVRTKFPAVPSRSSTASTASTTVVTAPALCRRVCSHSWYQPYCFWFSCANERERNKYWVLGVFSQSQGFIKLLIIIVVQSTNNRQDSFFFFHVNIVLLCSSWHTWLITDFCWR